MLRTAIAPILALFMLAAHADSVTLTAADGTQVYGEVWRAAGARPPLVVLFHQAESSSA